MLTYNIQTNYFHKNGWNDRNIICIIVKDINVLIYARYNLVFYYDLMSYYTWTESDIEDYYIYKHYISNTITPICILILIF